MNADLPEYVNVEQLFQLFTLQRPVVTKLYPKVFLDDGPYPTKLVEIRGPSDLGKQYFLLNILAKLIMPVSFLDVTLPGRNGVVLFLNIDHNITLQTFANYIADISKKYFQRQQDITELVNFCISKLKIINIYSPAELKEALDNLPAKITGNVNVCAVVIDSLTSFYWVEKEMYGFTGSEQYNNHLLTQLKQYMHGLAVVTFYTTDSSYADDNSLPSGSATNHADYVINISDGVVTGYKLVMQGPNFSSEIHFNAESLVADF